MQQPSQPVDAVADYADGPSRPAPTAVVSGRQVFRRRSQVTWGNPLTGVCINIMDLDVTWLSGINSVLNR